MGFHSAGIAWFLQNLHHISLVAKLSFRFGFFQKNKYSSQGIKDILVHILDTLSAGILRQTDQHSSGELQLLRRQ